MKIDYSEEGQLDFYKEINSKIREIWQMHVSEEEKRELYALVDETVKRYEQNIMGYFRKEEQLKNLNKMEENSDSLRRSNLETALKINSKLNDKIKPLAEKTLLNLKKPVNSAPN